MYGVIWAFAIPLNLMASYFNALRWWQDISQAQAVLLDQALGLPGCLELGLCLSLVFGVLAAMAAFGYLYNNRAACTIHALPVRREALFWSNYLAGFSFLLPIYPPDAGFSFGISVSVVAIHDYSPRFSFILYVRT